jgi:hypothetical protein
MAASDFRLDIDLGKTLGIPKIGGDAKGAVKPGSGIFSLPSMVNMANVAFKGIGVISDFKMQAAQAKLQTAAAEHEYWTKYASVNAQNYRNYELQLDSWYRQADYTERRRQYEEQLAKQRAVYKGEVATATTRDFQRKLADLEGRFYEEEARETIELENIRTQAIGRAAKVAASGQVGRSTVGMRTAFNQQWLSNISNRQMTRKFRIADKLNAGEALNAARQSTINQIQFYNPQPVADPVKPLAPLPIQSVAPTPVSGPSGSALGISLAKIGLEGYNKYKAMQPKPPTKYKETSFYGKEKPPATPEQKEVV